MNPTAQQQKIIDAPGNLVIVANPGSGKTFVLSEKIKKILPDTLEIKGVIAISYTNKSSQELKNRCLKNGLAPKASFFGTMDKFYLSEIIIPFAKQLFGIPKVEITVIRRNDLHVDIQQALNLVDSPDNLSGLSDDHIKLLKRIFLKGQIVLESVGILSVYIFDNSNACRTYIKARFTHIFIDEYQDCGHEQHTLFLKIKEIGLAAIAVGDSNQSIFKFSGKSSEHLIDLAKRNKEFQLFALDYNHRCHPSIINYSLLLLNKKTNLLVSKETHVHEKLISGNESFIAKWLSTAIAKYEKAYQITKRNDIGILVRNSRTGNIIHDHIGLTHKYFESTPLDNDFTIWSGLFRELLAVLFDKSKSKIEFIDSYIGNKNQRTKVSEVLKQILELDKMIRESPIDVDTSIDLFNNIAILIHPTGKNDQSINLLREVVSTRKLLDSYMPANENEIQIMSIHKSKGLEFEIVFHLDLYEWILPKKEIINSKKRFSDLTQDTNLHYVGITRAKKCCVLCYSNQRTNSMLETKTGNASEFLKLEILKDRKISSPF
jgi:superfamily I DNA/RNA helicase